MELCTNIATNDLLLNSVCDFDLTEFKQRIHQMSISDTYTGPVELDSTKTTQAKLRLLSSSDIVCTKLWHGFIYNCLSRSNHLVNNMSYHAIRQCLSDHNLNQLGSLAILKRRMLEFLKRIRDCQRVGYGELDIDRLYNNSLVKNDRVLDALNDNVLKENQCQTNVQFKLVIDLPKEIILKPDTFYSYFLIIDLEATCDEPVKTCKTFSKIPTYNHEIIEFPILLYDTRLGQCVSVFHAYCRPQINPILSTFCTNLTQIKQNDVTNAQPFLTVLKQIENWLFNVHNLANAKCAVLCDCSADMSKFMRLQCQLSKINFPRWASVWINLSKTFRHSYKLTTSRLNLDTMLKYLDLEFVGQRHRGFDDAWNILRVVRILHIDGCVLRVNERLSSDSRFVASVSKQLAETAHGPMGCLLKSCKLSGSRNAKTGRNSNDSIGSTSSSGSNAENKYNPLDHLDEEQTQSLLWLAKLQQCRHSNT